MSPLVEKINEENPALCKMAAEKLSILKNKICSDKKNQDQFGLGKTKKMVENNVRVELNNLEVVDEEDGKGSEEGVVAMVGPVGIVALVSPGKSRL